MALAHGAQQLEVFETVQHPGSPLFPARIVESAARYRAMAANGAQVAAIALRPFVTAAEAVENQAVEGPILLAAQRQAEHVRWRHAQQVACRLGLLAVDQARQLADATALTKTS